jgi:hypothetical protein
MSFLLNLLGGISGQVYIYIAIVFAGFGGGWYVEHLALVDYKQEVQIAAQTQIDANKAKLKEQEIINENIKQTYDARIDNIKHFYGGMLNTRSSPTFTVPTATISVNGTTKNVVDFTEQCAETTQQLVTLQDWINQQVGIDAK